MTSEFSGLVAGCRDGSLNVQDNSRAVQPGDIFVAMPGLKPEYLAQAAENGARWIICEHENRDAFSQLAPQCKIIEAASALDALMRLARAKWHTEDLPMRVIGITGTNGKTTCAWMLEYLFSRLGHTTALLGTIEYHWPGHREAAPLTTPGLLSLQSMFGSMRACQVDTVIMEASSHALSQSRVAGIDFDGAIFTNLTQDHLDYHRNMEDYFRAKAKLFLTAPKASKALAINSDDHYGRRLLELLPNALSFGLHKRLPGQRHLWGEIKSYSPQGMVLEMSLGKSTWVLNTPLIGAFNAANLLAVQALALELGLDPASFGHLEKFGGVPGRLERISNPEGYNIFVDYAHTPDALANALRALRGAGFTRVIAVFGCGGNRDRDKRPLMGKAVAENADIAILTSDNPRHEDPLDIIREVKPGLAKAKWSRIEADRRKATELALELAQPGDAILIAGKGHENYQIIGDQRLHYSDQEVARELLGCA